MYQVSRSQQTFEQCSKYLARGIGRQVRSAPDPVLFFMHGKGSKLYDVVGNDVL